MHFVNAFAAYVFLRKKVIYGLKGLTRKGFGMLIKLVKVLL